VFAEHVGDGPVLDLGCGPGRITAHLAGLGLDVSGADLSPAMVAEAGRRYPDLRFTVARLDAPGVPDGSLAGLVAWYSLIHVPSVDLPRTLRAVTNALAPGGYLQLAFHHGRDHRTITEAYGHVLDLDAWHLDPDDLTPALAEVGLEVTATVVRAPEGPERSAQAYLLARKA
jgi:trans-aconitate methyltransferase